MREECVGVGTCPLSNISVKLLSEQADRAGSRDEALVAAIVAGVRHVFLQKKKREQSSFLLSENSNPTWTSTVSPSTPLA